MKYYINKASGIEHQRSSNRCVNFGISSCMEALFAKVTGEMHTFSNSWLMMLCKKDNADKSPNATGTKIYTALDMATKYGITEESVYSTWDNDDKPYDNEFPTAYDKHYDNAKQFKISKWSEVNIDDIDGIKKAIENNGGLVASITIYPEHQSPYKNTFVKKIKRHSYSNKHCIWLCGYVEDMPQYVDGVLYRNWFVLQESYGDTIGNKGYIYVPYEAFSEKWYGLYSVEQYIQKLYKVEYVGEMKNPRYHDNNKLDFPRTNITLKIDNDIAKVNGKDVKLQCAAKIVDGRTFVPLRFVSQSFNSRVFWNQDKQEINIYNKDMGANIYMWIGKDVATVSQGGKKRELKLSTKPFIDKSGFTLVGMRDICTLFEASIEWCKDTREVKITGMI